MTVKLVNGGTVTVRENGTVEYRRTGERTMRLTGRGTYAETVAWVAGLADGSAGVLFTSRKA